MDEIDEIEQEDREAMLEEIVSDLHEQVEELKAALEKITITPWRASIYKIAKEALRKVKGDVDA